MQIPAKVDYALRALLELARLSQPATGDALAEAQCLPPKFLAAILNDLRHAGFIASRRGTGHRGYELARPADQITVADIMRSLDGTLVEINGRPPELGDYPGAAKHLRDVWVAARTSLNNVFEAVTLDHIAGGGLPRAVTELLTKPISTCSPDIRPSK